jgi:hypothetical protein
VELYLQSPLRFTDMVRFFLFTGATTLCVSWSPPWFHNCIIFRGIIVIPKQNPQPVGPETTLRLALDLSGRGGPIRSLRSRQHSPPGHGGLKPLHSKTIFLEELWYLIAGRICIYLYRVQMRNKCKEIACVNPQDNTIILLPKK